MDRSQFLTVATAFALCLLSRVEYNPAFATAKHERAPPSLQCNGNAGIACKAGRPQAAAGCGSSTVVAVFGLGAAGLGFARRLAQQGSARSRVQARADGSGLVAKGPIAVYSQALMDGAKKNQESVTVTKDVMKIKSLFEDIEFMDELLLINNEVGASQLDKANAMIKTMQPLESTVMPKFIIFLAKKKRLLALKSICKEYVTTLYQVQSIATVVVKSPYSLPVEQLEAIKEKMKVKTGTQDIKLIPKIEMTLLGGFIVEWGFTDPDNLEAPTEALDLSLKNVLNKAAISKGVIASV